MLGLCSYCYVWCVLEASSAITRQVAFVIVLHCCTSFVQDLLTVVALPTCLSPRDFGQSAQQAEMLHSCIWQLDGLRPCQCQCSMYAQLQFVCSTGDLCPLILVSCVLYICGSIMQTVRDLGAILHLSATTSSCSAITARVWRFSVRMLQSTGVVSVHDLFTYQDQKGLGRLCCWDLFKCRWWQLEMWACFKTNVFKTHFYSFKTTK